MHAVNIFFFIPIDSRGIFLADQICSLATPSRRKKRRDEKKKHRKRKEKKMEKRKSSLHSIPSPNLVVIKE